MKSVLLYAPIPRKYKSPQNSIDDKEKAVFYSSILIVEEYNTKGGVITEESKQLNFYNVQIRKGRKIVAHVSCNYSNEKIQIQDLYVLKKYRKKGLGDVLLSKVFEYAAEKKAQTIVAYCGPEPFCEDAQIPLNEEIDFYESHGFVHDHNVMGVTPCMVKTLSREVVV